MTIIMPETLFVTSITEDYLEAIKLQSNKPTKTVVETEEMIEVEEEEVQEAEDHPQVISASTARERVIGKDTFEFHMNIEMRENEERDIGI